MNFTVVSSRRLTVIWSLLLAATALSCTLGREVPYLSLANAGVAIILLAFIKIRFVMFEFMEVRCAPMPLRLICEFWVMITCAGIVLLYRV